MKNLRILLPFTLILMYFSHLSAQKTISYVNPFIGTHHMGHTYPGATLPFGMVQLSPETDTILYSYGKGYNPKTYEYCAGYQYADNTIVGFTHTHFSGTGHSDLGDFLIMPTTGALKLNPGTSEKPESGYRSRFSHERESASPGYYSVILDDYNIKAELTATTRCGIHQYSFPSDSDARIILDMNYGIYNYDGKTIWSFVRVENDTLITGYRQTRGWARTRYIYFAMSLSSPIKNYGHKNDEKKVYNGFYRKFDEFHNFPEMAGKDVRAYFEFGKIPGNKLVVRMAISAVSTEGALKNLMAESSGKTFEQIRHEAESAWENELSKIRIKASPEVMKNFYTSLYHAYLSPTIYQDVDGKYRGIDQNIHEANNFTNYTTFSLWDTYRALHPLFTIFQQQRTADMVNSMLAHYQQSVHKILPIWSHHANENWCMTGYHSVPVIADAMMKNIQGFDYAEGLKACVSSANYDVYDGIGDYKKYGYLPYDLSGNAASKTLEYAYDDWCIAQMAKKLNKQNFVSEYEKRAASYKMIFDPSVGFMRAKHSDGSWKPEFNPMATENQGFIEGNSWNYSLHVPHDVNGLKKLLGGNKKLETYLDSLFTMHLPDHEIPSEDINRVGIIGNYVHGNEPSHHVPYLYNDAGVPWKTQKWVRKIMNTMYRPEPGGLCGNDDCGQMSAWYIFSAMGFYPVCPGSNEYYIGSPVINELSVKLENGEVFRILVKNQSPENIFVNSVRINEKVITGGKISHEDIMKGGTMTFEMSRQP